MRKLPRFHPTNRLRRCISGSAQLTQSGVSVPRPPGPLNHGGVDAVGEEGEGVLRAEEPDDGHAWGSQFLVQDKGWRTKGPQRTEVLHVLVSQDPDGPRVPGAGLGAGLEGFVDDDAVGRGGGEEGEAVREAGHAAVVVEAHPREGIPDGGEDQEDVAAEC